MEGLVDCLVGLQWGSEGKGKFSAYLAREYNGIVRSGGPQAGHTFYVGDEKCINRQVPCGVRDINRKLYISAGGVINLDVLKGEIESRGLTPEYLMIDNNAVVVTTKHIGMEQDSFLKKRLASTLEGVGAAQSEKVWRRAKLFGNNNERNSRDCFVYDMPELYFFAGDVSKSINQQMNVGAPILLEGTQGFGLCLNHGGYPFVTSRDVNSASLLSDAGISPKYYGQTIGVMRTYPIRVGGNSGPTGSKEISWKKITKRAGSKKPLEEITTVTGRVRRIFEQDFSELNKAIEINQPEQIALSFLDYINMEDYGKNCFEDLSEKSKNYLSKIERFLGVPITLIGTGPKNEHLIDLRTETQKRIPLENIALYLNGFPDNFMGCRWDSGELERFIERKMTACAIHRHMSYDRKLVR
ncbi:MAG: adenylosuccinate synthetase [Nanoarchaeota archaeon]|nr:adenylosuccinate synthetase [Nanoarchaeota archaeon]